MNDRDLRTGLIRLAHTNPDNIREKILPLLKNASPPNDPKAQAAEKLGEELQGIEKDLKAVYYRMEGAQKLAKKAGVKAGSGFYSKGKTVWDLASEAAKAFTDSIKEWDGE